MFDIKKLFKRKDEVDNYGVKVVYENKAVESRILYWVNSRFSNNNFEKVLLDIGFKSGDKVYIYENKGQLFEFYYSVNKDEVVRDNVIEFVFNKNQFMISDKDIERCYGCSSEDDSEKQITLLYYNKKISDEVSCSVYYENNSFLFMINNGDYKFDLEIYINTNNGLENIKELEDYLTNLSFPILIEDVYKKIKDILSVDENAFDMFNLVVTKFIGITEEVTDLILLYKGELYEFVRTSDGRRIALDEDGNWTYDKLDSGKVLSIKYRDDNEPKYRYSFKDMTLEQDGYFSGRDFLELKYSAENEVEDVKRLAKNMFPRKND